MLRWSFIFLLLAVGAGILGFSGLAGAATGLVRTLFFTFLILLMITAAIGARGWLLPLRCAGRRRCGRGFGVLGVGSHTRGRERPDDDRDAKVTAHGDVS